MENGRAVAPWCVILGIAGLAGGRGGADRWVGAGWCRVAARQPDVESGERCAEPDADVVDVDWVPVGFQASAEMAVTLWRDADLADLRGVQWPAAGFAGRWTGSMQLLLNQAGIASAGGTVEFVIGCYSGSGGTGTAAFTHGHSGSTSSADGAPARPRHSARGDWAGVHHDDADGVAEPGQTGATVTLTANVSAADSTTPAGTVQFEVGGTNIGAPVAVNGGGVATAATTTTFALGGHRGAIGGVHSDCHHLRRVDRHVSRPARCGGEIPRRRVAPIRRSPCTPLSGPLSAVGGEHRSPAVAEQRGHGGHRHAGQRHGEPTARASQRTPSGLVGLGPGDATSPGPRARAPIPGDQLGWMPAFVGSAVDGAVLGPTIAAGTSPGGLGDTGGVLISATPGNGFGINSRTLR